MNENGIPGILIGRYPGDIYAGGNPWQLLTAVLAECFYLAAAGTLKSIDMEGTTYCKSETTVNSEWNKLLSTKNGNVDK